MKFSDGFSWTLTLDHLLAADHVMAMVGLSLLFTTNISHRISCNDQYMSVFIPAHVLYLNAIMLPFLKTGRILQSTVQGKISQEEINQLPVKNMFWQLAI